MDWELMNYLKDSIEAVGGKVELLQKPQPASPDVYQTYGQVLFEQSCQRDEDFDFVKVRLEMVALRNPFDCVYVRTEGCYLNGEAIVDHVTTERGFTSHRFDEIHKAVKYYDMMKGLWESYDRPDDDKTTLGDFEEGQE